MSDEARRQYWRTAQQASRRRRRDEKTWMASEQKPRLFCESAKCRGHLMTLEQIEADILRWPRARMVNRNPPTPQRRRRRRLLETLG